jgi:hypothetical protein
MELLLYPTFVTAAVLGALVASREPRNAVGWLMGAASLAAMLFLLPLDYGYAARVIEPGLLPLILVYDRGLRGRWFDIEPGQVTHRTVVPIARRRVLQAGDE